MRKVQNGVSVILVLVLEFVSDFDIRISDFPVPPLLLRFCCGSWWQAVGQVANLPEKRVHRQVGNLPHALPQQKLFKAVVPESRTGGLLLVVVIDLEFGVK